MRELVDEQYEYNCWRKVRSSIYILVFIGSDFCSCISSMKQLYVVVFDQIDHRVFVTQHFIVSI